MQRDGPRLGKKACWRSVRSQAERHARCPQQAKPGCVAGLGRRPPMPDMPMPHLQPHTPRGTHLGWRASRPTSLRDRPRLSGTSGLCSASSAAALLPPAACCAGGAASWPFGVAMLSSALPPASMSAALSARPGCSRCRLLPHRRHRLHSSAAASESASSSSRVPNASRDTTRSSRSAGMGGEALVCMRRSKGGRKGGGRRQGEARDGSTQAACQQEAKAGKAGKVGKRGRCAAPEATGSPRQRAQRCTARPRRGQATAAAWLARAAAPPWCLLGLRPPRQPVQLVRWRQTLPPRRQPPRRRRRLLYCGAVRCLPLSCAAFLAAQPAGEPRGLPPRVASAGRFCVAASLAAE